MDQIYTEIRLALHAIWIRRWLALAVAWGLCLLGWLILAFIPNAYESKAKVSVMVQTTLQGKTGIEPRDLDKDIARVRQTLTSTTNLEKVVRGTSLARTVSSDADIADRIADLQDGITVEEKQEGILEITAEVAFSGLSDAENAKLAPEVAQKLIDIFIEENLIGDRAETSQALKFLDARVAERQKQLEEMEAKRTAFEQKYLGLLPGENSASSRMEMLRSELSRVDSDLISAQSALNSYNTQIAGTPPTISQPGFGASGVGPARARLSALEGQLADMRGKGWTDNHPDVQSIKAQIPAARAAAAGEPAGGAGGMMQVPNPTYSSLRTMQAEKQASVSALTSRKAQIESEIAGIQGKLASEPGVQAEMDKINRDYDVLKKQYEELLANREEVKMRGQVETQTNAVQFRVTDPPSQPRSPSAPNRPLFLFGIMLLSIFAGVGTAFAKSQLQTNFSTPQKLEKATGLSVIGSISETVSAVARTAANKRNKQFAMATAGLGGAFLLLMALEFVKRTMVA